MIFPSIHLNGTSKDALLEQLQGAYTALNAAFIALENAAPNGRDYYPQGSGAISKATAEHTVRLLAIEQVRAEIHSLMEHVVDAKGGR